MNLAGRGEIKSVTGGKVAFGRWVSITIRRVRGTPGRKGFGLFGYFFGLPIPRLGGSCILQWWPGGLQASLGEGVPIAPTQVFAGQELAVSENGGMDIALLSASRAPIRGVR